MSLVVCIYKDFATNLSTSFIYFFLHLSLNCTINIIKFKNTVLTFDRVKILNVSSSKSYSSVN